MKYTNGRRVWSKAEDAKLLQLLQNKTPMHLIKESLGRTAAAILCRQQVIKRQKI
jgi:hypothetical protein